jgi:hypothetical protein
MYAVYSLTRSLSAEASYVWRYHQHAEWRWPRAYAWKLLSFFVVVTSLKVRSSLPVQCFELTSLCVCVCVCVCVCMGAHMCSIVQFSSVQLGQGTVFFKVFQWLFQFSSSWLFLFCAFRARAATDWLTDWLTTWCWPRGKFLHPLRQDCALPA